MGTDFLAIRSRAQSRFDLVGPNIEDDVRRLLARYGSTAVTDTVRRLTKAKRGRRALKGWEYLMPWIEDDARQWLNGDDSFEVCRTYNIAKEYAEQSPEHERILTIERVERKLRAKRYGHRWFVLLRAMELSRDDYSYTQHIRALEALGTLESSAVWRSNADRLRANVTDYIAKWGQPASDLTVKQIEEGALMTV